MTTVRQPTSRRSTHRLFIVDQQHGFYTALGYQAARTAAHEGRSYNTAPSSEHEMRDRTKLINQSRDFLRNNSIYKGMISAAVSYIVAGGFELQVQSGRPTIDHKIEQLWRDWFIEPEIRGLLSGPKLAQMICRELLVAGDVTLLKTKTGRVQIFEAEQLAGPKYSDTGIATDGVGRPETFHLCPWKKTGVDTRKGKSIEAKNILYIALLERASQLRGVPAAQSSFAMMHRINDICDAEAVAWQLLSRMACAITREEAAETSYTESREDDTKSSDDTDGDLATRVTDVDYALFFHANPGEKIEGIERNIPGQNFSESLRMFLRMLGLPLGLPLEITLLDWTQSNYSQSRAVLQQAYQRFQNIQSLIEDRFYRPLFDWKLAEWNQQGLIGKRNAIRHEWIKPEYPWLDQLKEAKAWATQVERGFTTHSQVCKSLNKDRSDENERRQREFIEAIKIAQDIEAKTGVAVPWEPFAGLKASGQGAGKGELAGEAETESANENADENADENAEALAEAVADAVIDAIEERKS